MKFANDKCVKHLNFNNIYKEDTTMKCISTTRKGKDCTFSPIEGHHVCKKHLKAIYSANESRKYIIFTSIRSKNTDMYQLYIKDIIKLIKNNSILYEGLYGKVKPYFDFDFKYSTKDEQEADELNKLQLCIGAVKSFCNTNNIIVLTACGKKSHISYTNSIHIIVNNGKVYNSGYELRDYLKTSWYDNDIMPDLNAYSSLGRRQLFRMLSSVKDTNDTREFLLTHIEGDKIVKLSTSDLLEHKDLIYILGQTMISQTNDNDILYNNNEDIDTTTTEWEKFSKYYSEISKDFKYTSSQTLDNGNIIINAKRLNPSYCRICDRIHDKDNTLYLTRINYENGFELFYSCIRDKDVKILIYTNRKNKDGMRSFIQNSINNIPDINTLHIIEQNSLKKTNVNIKVANTQFCSDIPELKNKLLDDTSGIVYIKSQMGTGKTLAHSLYTKNKKRVGVISYRRSIAQDGKRNLYKDFNLYLDDKNKSRSISDDKWICQLDSLYKILNKDRIKIDNWMTQEILIDEARQVMNHLTSKTYMKQPMFERNLKAFYYLIRNSKKLVIMDANLDKTCIDFYNNIRRSANSGDVEPILIWNKYSNMDLTINITHKSEYIIEYIKNDLENCKPFYLAFNGSIEKQQALKNQLLVSYPNKKILVINSHTQTDNDVIELLNDHSNIRKYNGLIVSPSIQGGVSFSERNYIHTVYGMIGNCTNSSSDVCQMLRRVRYPINKNIIVGLSITNFNIPMITSSDVDKHLMMNCDLINDINFKGDYNDNGIWQIQKDDFYKLYCKNTASKNLDRDQFVKYFIRYLVSYGMRIKFIDDKSDKLHDNKKELQIELNKIKIEDCERLSKTPDITSFEYNALQNKDPVTLTKNEHDSMTRYMIKSIYRIDNKELSPEWFDQYSKQKNIKAFRNLSYYFSDQTEKTLTESLVDLKTREAAERDSIRYDENGDQASSTNICLSLLKKQPKSPVHTVLIDWLSILGIQSFDPVSPLNRDVDLSVNNIHNRFGYIHKKYLSDKVVMSNLISLLGKDKRSFRSIHKANMRAISIFVNKSLTSEFNISITKESRHGNYTIKSPVNNIFKSPYKNYDNCNIPTLGYNNIKSDSYVSKPGTAEYILESLKGANCDV